MYEALSPFARNLIAQAIEGIGPDGPVDHHLHIAGLGTTPGIWLHPDYRSWRHPFRALQANFLLRAGGMRTRRNADAEYLDHLFQTVERSGLGGSYLLYALDWRYERPPGNRRIKTRLSSSLTIPMSSTPLCASPKERRVQRGSFPSLLSIPTGLTRWMRLPPWPRAACVM